jgi:hypothetical protein
VGGGSSSPSPIFRSSSTKNASSLIRPVGVYQSPSTLPSLATNHARQKGPLSSGKFIKTLPVVQRNRINLLFEGSDTIDDEDEGSKPNIPTGFSRSGLKTPPDIRRAIQAALFHNSMEKSIAAANAANSVQEDFDKAGAKNGEEMSSSQSKHVDVVFDGVLEKKERIMGHSIYFLTLEEKKILNPQMFQMEEELSERVNDAIAHLPSGGVDHTLAVYNSVSTAPEHEDHSRLSSPASSRPTLVLPREATPAETRTLMVLVLMERNLA